ncbi:hypothetical protein LX36DRAFT_397264 [Colletotrichum falcatum]|nr:hypothetical protein LX36DRAFT_397264 [Colletotrichum falcatum]
MTLPRAYCRSSESWMVRLVPERRAQQRSRRLSWFSQRRRANGVASFVGVAVLFSSVSSVPQSGFLSLSLPLSSQLTRI